MGGIAREGHLEGRKIFLDIGSHHGESLAYALDPIFAFDQIFAFEPSSSCWKQLEKFSDPRLSIQRFGLAAKSGEAVLYSSGSVGASLFPDKESRSRLESEVVELVGTFEWVCSQTMPTDRVYVKINCEGGELEIIKEILRPEIAPRIAGLIFTPDLLKVESLRGKYGELQQLLTTAPFPWVERIERHTSRQFIEWLSRSGTTRAIVPRLAFLLGFRQPRYFVFRLKANELLPTRFTKPLFSIFGRTAWRRRLERYPGVTRMGSRRMS